MHPQRKLSRAVSAWATSMTLLGCATSAMAGKANDTLVYASDSEPENVSPYHNNLREGVILAHLAWDTLIYRNPETNEYEPRLATEWEWADESTLDLVLREGVTFHNGEAFDADDVVFTFNYAVSPESRVVTRQNVDWMESVEKLDDYQVRIHLKEPFPAALEYLSGPMPIYPDEYFQEVGIEGFSRQPVGTGPYRITNVRPGDGVSLTRFDDYFEDSPIGQPAIGNIEFKAIADEDSRMAQLMSGQVDWIWRVPADQAESLGGMPQLSVLGGETMRVGYIGLDAASREDSPLHDLRVRQAINHAMNREGLANDLVRGGSQPSMPLVFLPSLAVKPRTLLRTNMTPQKPVNCSLKRVTPMVLISTFTPTGNATTPKR